MVANQHNRDVEAPDIRTSYGLGRRVGAARCRHARPCRHVLQGRGASGGPV